MTLNKEKCKFNQESLYFLGHRIDRNGVSPDPNKTAAILKMETPKTVSELRRFMGMVNQLGKCSPHIADLSKPLCELLSTKKAWVWNHAQDTAFEQINKICCPSFV